MQGGLEGGTPSKNSPFLVAAAGEAGSRYQKTKRILGGEASPNPSIT